MARIDADDDREDGGNRYDDQYEPEENAACSGLLRENPQEL